MMNMLCLIHLNLELLIIFVIHIMDGHIKIINVKNVIHIVSCVCLMDLIKNIV